MEELIQYVEDIKPYVPAPLDVHTRGFWSSFRSEALLVLGDTNSCLSVIPAKRRKIPIFHMEAGNRCFDQRVPEETNRRIVDHTADINLTYSSIAREYLLREGLPPDQIIKTGNPMFEADALPRAYRCLRCVAAAGTTVSRLLRGECAPRGKY